ncbi:ParA-like protein [Anaerohalosphaera lusitana]|uniref:ParA-like protein n=1 Tax=Anaerohalosphaera lusitana TaxID=1936003 RepID=A0A1U9NL35_9BACT|nr:ATP-binding protein [Anaerohalosphaera lusitana]AQT68641.1 ParA-like protein [Anaerohalosphaera lusitana]
MKTAKTIAIASGKGGTGKTTVSTNLAWTAADRFKSAYLDCDVEEPNGGIFLKPAIEASKTVHVDVPQVDISKCSGCGKCGRLCQYSAIAHLGGQNVITFENMCHSCGGCMRICPTGAITAKKMEIGTVSHGSAGKLRFAGGLLKLGSVRTPSLIHEVLAGDTDAELRFVDAPPGTSCPVIAAVRGADYVILVTEPTPFGLNDLRLAVDMCRALRLDCGLVINNAYGEYVPLDEYVDEQELEVLGRIEYDRKIAEAYSRGEMIVDSLPTYGKVFGRILDRVLEHMV